MLPYSTQPGAGFDVFDEDDFTDRLDAYIAAPVVPTRDDLLDDYLGRRLGGAAAGGVAGRRRTRAHRAGLVRLPPRARMLGRVLRGGASARDSGRLVLRGAGVGAVLQKVKMLTGGAAAVWQRRGRSGGGATAAAAEAAAVTDVARDEWMEFACNRKGKRRVQRQRRGLVWWNRISRVFA